MRSRGCRIRPAPLAPWKDRHAAAEREVVAVPPLLGADSRRTTGRGVRPGIVHLGVGAFHRSHQAMYVDRLLEQGQAQDWGICGVGVLPSDRRMAEVMAAQDGLYTLVVKHPDGTLEARVVGSIVEYLLAPDDPEAVIEKMAAESTRIVSLTVTEGGYNISPVTGEFDATTPTSCTTCSRGRRRARASGWSPRRWSAGGERGLAPFTVVSCDNIQSNGDVARRSFSAFAGLRDRGTRRLGRAGGVLPELDGRPDHPGHHGRGPGRGRPAARRRRPVAGGVRALHAVGAGGQRSVSAGRRWRTPASRWSTTSSRTS